MWLVLIAFVALANIIAVLMVRKHLLAQPVEAIEEAKWKTVGVYHQNAKFTDSKKPYSATYVLEISQFNERRISFRATPPEDEDHIKKHYFRCEEYLVYMIPWEQGSISLEELVTALPKIKTPLVKPKS